MEIDNRKILDLLYGDERSRRYTQDSPILPEVWLAYFNNPNSPADLLLNPNRASSAGALHRILNRDVMAWRAARVGGRGWKVRPSTRPMVFHESHVVAELWFEDLVRVALPLTQWWWKYVWRVAPRPDMIEASPAQIDRVAEALERGGSGFTEDLIWLIKVIGHFECASGAATAAEPGPAELAAAALKFFDGMPLATLPESFPLWSISLNREARPALWRSVRAVKGDAAQRLFSLSCRGLRWAVVDSGIDASHPAFIDRSRGAGESAAPKKTGTRVPPLGETLASSRVVKTYDFSRLRSLLDPDCQAAGDAEAEAYPPEVRRQMKEMKRSLRSGKAIDWGALEPKLRVVYDDTYEQYRNGLLEHGTHVAGIIGADWRVADGSMPDGETEDLKGMCPDIELYDLRVVDADGKSSEFVVMAALQFVRWLNASKDQPVIHGVNLSLSIRHEVRSFACGRTPVCEECERLIGSGVVVVAAAGNLGHNAMLQSLGAAEYQGITITDPGNAEGVLTVGATHRYMPHAYGVSYFSSRGPTGDGRSKPDLVAPGEKIKSLVPLQQTKSLDGTSMAAPHVSGAAALIMARHTEFIGQPGRIKEILMQTATDLGRERYFQGAGMLDILRALQSV